MNLSESNYNREPYSSLKEFLNKDSVRKCIDRIISARARLRELRQIQSELIQQNEIRNELASVANGLISEINAGIDEIQGELEKGNLDLIEKPNDLLGESLEHWSLGKEKIRGPIIPFLRGELEPVRSVIVAPDLPEPIVVLFLSISGLRDQLVREIHGHWGYHYHYLDAKGRRSDTLLTFEQKPMELGGGQQARVLTWERHSENSHFAARAGSWGGKKRESVYEACVGDSDKRSLSDFKTPAKDAETVWPL